jgi:hypothetical protein
MGEAGMDKFSSFYLEYRKRLIEGRYSTETIDEFFEIINKYRYIVIGGFAVGYYTGDFSRVSLGDIDILILRDDFDRFARDMVERGYSVRRGATELYGVAHFTKNGIEFDVLISDDSTDEDAIMGFRRFKYKNKEFRISPEWFLILRKLELGRDKDIDDVIELSKNVDIDEMYDIISEYRPDIAEDFLSYVQ